jgi:hypothetical protein
MTADAGRPFAYAHTSEIYTWAQEYILKLSYTLPNHPCRGQLGAHLHSPGLFL